MEENLLSYFLKDNSGLSFLSGETLSAVVLGCLFCAGVELRFLGGIAISTYFTKRRSKVIRNMLSSLRRQVRRRKFKARYTSSVATMQQPRLPETPLSCALDVCHRFTPPSTSATVEETATSSPPRASTIPSVTNFNQMIEETGTTQQIFMFVSASSHPPSAGDLQGASMTTENQTHPKSRHENAGKVIRNIRSRAFIPPFKASARGLVLVLFMTGDSKCGLSYQ